MTRIIEAIEVRRLALPTGIKPFTMPNGQLTPTDLSALLVRVTDGDGADGLSLLWAQRAAHLPVIEGSLRYLAGVVLGQLYESPARCLATMRRSAAFLGVDGPLAIGASGIEMALQDLDCRRDGVALADRLGRRRDRVPAYQTGLMLSSDVGELVEEAETIVAGGIRAIKMIVGGSSIATDVERVAAVRLAVPADVTLMVDALQHWTLEQATVAASELDAFDLAWIEEPLPHDDPDGYRALADRCRTRLATGELCFATSSFDRFLDLGLPCVVGELERLGGITGWLEIAARANARSAVMLPHLYPHVSAQVLASLPQDEIWLEYVPWFDGLMGTRPTISDGEVHVPSDPGTGFDPDPDAVERLATGPWVGLCP